MHIIELYGGITLSYKRRGIRNEVRVGFYQDKSLSRIPPNPRFVFAKMWLRREIRKERVADSETKQKGKKLDSKSHIIIPSLYFGLLCTTSRLVVVVVVY
jgi:hypothetical protein